jgi:D-sedoheptulose 7-phosphate isomerase
MSFENEEHIKEIITSSMDAKEDLLNSTECIEMISKLARFCLDALVEGGKIIFAGNGGSFGDSQHISAEFTSRFLFDRKPLASIALGTNSSSMSAIGNDYGYEYVFSRELEALGKSEDIFVPISTSGNSSNILEAINIANEKNIKTIGLTGSNQGKMNGMCECISVPSTDTGRIQECHILIGHIVCGLVENLYFKK